LLTPCSDSYAHDPSITKIYITGRAIHDEQPEMTGGSDERPPRPSRAQREFTRDYSDEDELPEGSVSWKLFGIVFGSVSSLFAISFFVILSVGLVFGATLGAGIGGFVASFENVTYNQGDAAIYPILDGQAACDHAPHLGATLNGSSTLRGDVQFYKDLPLPSGSGEEFDTGTIARIAIIADAPSGGINVQDLDLRLSALSADRAEFGSTVVREFGPNAYGTNDNESFAPFGNAELDPDASTDPNRVPEYGIDAELFNLDNGTAAAHQVSFQSISLETVNLAVFIDDKSNFTNPTVRVVEPNNRTCDSLVKTS